TTPISCTAPYTSILSSSLSCSLLSIHPTTTATSTLSLHDALPISRREPLVRSRQTARVPGPARGRRMARASHWSDSYWAMALVRSEEHTSELQSRGHLVCRLLLEKKKMRLAWQTADDGTLPAGNAS